MTTQTEPRKPKALVLLGGLLLVVLLGVAVFSSGGGDSYEEKRDDAELACIEYVVDPAEHAACIDYEMGR